MVKIQVKKAVGYARVSSESQTDNTSIDLQIQKIKEYCKLYDISLDKIFIDEAQSGKTDNRKAYKEMLDYVGENGTNAVIVYKADRTHRKLKNLLIMIDELEQQEVAYISITENFDTSTPQGMLFLQMIGGFAEFERKIINERTQSGRIEKAKSKRFAGGKIPYGYKLVNGDHLEVVPEEAAIVNEIFKKRVDGNSLGRIARELNNTGITNKQGRSWTKQSIDYILKNETYAGVYKYDGDKEKNDITFKIDKVVSRQLFNKVNS